MRSDDTFDFNIKSKLSFPLTLLISWAKRPSSLETVPVHVVECGPFDKESSDSLWPVISKTWKVLKPYGVQRVY